MMQRRLNVKVLGGSLAGVVAVAVLVHLVHSHQIHRNASALLHQADRAAGEKDFAKASGLYQQYLAFEPNDTEALLRFADVGERSSSSFQTRFHIFLLLEQALRRDPERDDLRRRAVTSAIGLDRYQDAIRHLEHLLTKAPRQPDLVHQLGWCQEAVGQYADSARSLRRAIALAPTQVESYILLADLLSRQLQQPAEAPKIMDALVAANPQSWKAYLARAKFHYAKGDVEATAADIYKACALAPQNDEVLLAGAEVALLKGNLNEARGYVQRGLALNPKNEQLYRSLATLEARCGQPEAAVVCLRRGLDQLPESVGLHAQLAEVLLDQGRRDEAGPLLSWVRDHGPPAGLVDYLEGRVQMLDRQWYAAADKLLAARARLGLGSEWMSNVSASLGRCYEGLGESDLRLAAFREAVVLNAGNVPARLELARALLAARFLDEAILELGHLTARPDVPARYWVLYAQALTCRYQRSQPTAKERQELDDVLQKAAAAEPAAWQLQWLRAERAILEGDKAAGLSLLGKAVLQRREEAGLWVALADMQARLGNDNDALATLQKAVLQCGPHWEIQQALVKYWSSRPGAEASAALATIAKQAADLPRDDRVHLLRAVADAALLLGDQAQAEQALRQLAALLPRDLRSRIALFDLALSDGRDADALAWLADLRRLEGEEGVLWRTGEASRAILATRKGDRTQLAIARKRLGEVRERHPRGAHIALLDGYVEELDGQPDRAMACYRRAIDLGERPPAIVLRVAQWLYAQQRYGDVDQVLRQLEEVAPLPLDHARLGAEVAIHTLAFKRAVMLARQVVPAKSRDYREQLWLAHIQSLAGQPLEAEETLRLAVATGPRIPETWLALVGHLHRTQQRLELEAVLQQMRQTVPKDRAALTEARCLEAAGRFEQAEACFQQALAEGGGDIAPVRQVAEFYLRTDQPAKAEPHLRSLLAPGNAVPTEVAQWARRQLAVVLVLQRGPKGVQDALRELAGNATPRGLSVADQRVKAFVLATDPASRSAALQMFRETLSLQPLSAEEQFLFIQVCDANWEYAKSRERMLALLVLHRDNGQYLAYFARGLLQRGAVDDARYYFAALERLEPASARTQQLRLALRDAQSGG